MCNCTPIPCLKIFALVTFIPFLFVSIFYVVLFCIFILFKCSHPLSVSFYCPECICFNHSGIFIYSNYIPKCNWFPVPFIYSELEISLKNIFYDTSPPLLVTFFFFFLIHQAPEIQLNNLGRSWRVPMCKSYLEFCEAFFRQEIS